MKFLLVVVGLLVSSVVFAAEAPFALSARIEHVWSKLEVAQHDGDKQYDGDFAISAVPSFEVREDVYLIGRVTYPIQSERPQYAVGLEFYIYGAR